VSEDEKKIKKENWSIDLSYDLQNVKKLHNFSMFPSATRHHSLPPSPLSCQQPYGKATCKHAKSEIESVAGAKNNRETMSLCLIEILPHFCVRTNSAFKQFVL
jgi:hypothetical protein